MKNIRNFCIIAHIDHGKSTLADRLLEFTNTIQVTNGQMLDDMDLEKERGITIKSHAIQMEYTYKGEKYILNLIDTPGHVDFSYEVSRSIAACEGALLIVDASQGVQAQTISNLYMAIEHDLEIIPVINKCDMASAMPEEVEDEIVELLGCKRDEIIRASGKTGMGVEEILAAVIERIPHPEGDEEAPLQALIFDSVFNSFRGIIAYFKIVNGVIRKGDKVKFFNTGKEYDADEIGVLKMEMMPRPELRTGDVGYIISGIKTSKEVKVGDTITHIARPCEEAIAGFEEVKPMVFAGVYPIEAEDFEDLRSSLEKLQLNDASLTFQPESSLALGFGFRCGFLGLLHMEIVQERLDREFDMNVITTVPNVSYNIYDKHRPIYQCHLVCRQRTRPSPSVVGCELRFTSHCRRIERKQPSVGLCRPLSECITSCHIAIQIIVACRMSRFSFRPHETALPELIPPSAARLFVLCRMQFLFRFLQSGFPIGHNRSLYRMQGDSERLSVGGFPAFICPCLILRSAVMPPACAAEYQITRNAASEYQISQRVI